MDWPLPTLHTKPSLSSSRPWNKLSQAYEGRAPSFAFRKLLFGNYFSFSIRATKESGFLRSRHPYLANIAKLEHSKSLNPIPPTDLDSPILSQFIQTSLDSLSLCPQKKRFIRALSSRHKVLGRRKTLICDLHLNSFDLAEIEYT